MIRVLVTGATGFVGSILCRLLSESGYRVRAALRTSHGRPSGVAENTLVGDIAAPQGLDRALNGVDLVVHLAARSHVLRETQTNADLYDQTNARGTALLAEEAARAGVRRFIYLSSIKVNGEGTEGRAYTKQDQPRPQDVYGVSKWRGEQRLRELAAGSAMETVIVRAPLVYGPGVRANFLRLLTWVHKGWPLPLGAVRNRRSLVSVWNLCSLLMLSLESPAAANETWLVSDGEDLSTPELIERIARAMGRAARLPRVPVPALSLCGRLFGQGALVQRLVGSLVVDITQTRERLNWSPVVTVDQAIGRTTDWYLRQLSAQRGYP